MRGNSPLVQRLDNVTGGGECGTLAELDVPRIFLHRRQTKTSNV